MNTQTWPVFASRPLRRAAWVVGLAGVLALVFAAARTSLAQQPGQQPPPPTVGVVTVQPGAVPLITELQGRLEASRTAQVRARTAGVVLKRLFREGSEVKAGQSLFQIDNAPQMATLQSARATLAKAEASLGQTSALARRYQPLAEANAISQQEYDNARAAEKASRAEVLAAQAAVRTAEINLGYATVPAPIGGRIGKANITEGALVGQGESTLLATIQQMNPMVVNFTQSASEVLKLRRAIAGGKLAAVDGNPAVKVILEDGTVYAENARLLFTDATVDAGTGQVSLKAEVPNPQGVLLPGLFVRVQLEQAQAENAVLLPQQAVSRGSHGDSVLVVAADGSFAPRAVKVGPAQGDAWVVLDGLKAGEQVIVDGLSIVQMTGAKKVQTRPWQAGSGAAPAQRPAVGAADSPAAQ